MSAWARCDDLRAGTAWRFPPARRHVTAERPSEVAAAFDAVEAETRAGRWAFGFATYEAGVALLDPSAAPQQVPGLPLLWFGIGDAPEPVDLVQLSRPGAYTAGPWTGRWDEATYVDAVRAIREHIAAGDIYQANLTSQWSAEVDGDPRALYADLVHRQRAAYGMYVDAGRFAIASASPELFVEVHGERITMRPMKGTARRGRDRYEDALIVAALRHSEKERAENVMIVDLVRNDLARLARTGTVRVGSLLEVERFETVHQLTSEVTASTPTSVTLAEVFTALFPSGSVTGAPKRRAVQILGQLEDTPRGVYCGAVGYVAPAGHAPRVRLNVAIRTVTWDRLTGTASYGSGGAVTWNSDPVAEYRESLLKTAILAERPQDYALLETMRSLAGGGVYLLERHLQRLADSAGFLDFPFDRPRVCDAILTAAAQAPASTIRLTLDRAGSVGITTAPLPAPAERSPLLHVDADPVDQYSRWYRHKTTLRDEYERRRARHPEADEVVLVNLDGEVTEASTANIAARCNGRWVTPPVASGCLPGVERAELIAAGALTERRLTVADLHAAQQIALVSALRGWRPAILAPCSD